MEIITTTGTLRTWGVPHCSAGVVLVHMTPGDLIAALPARAQGRAAVIAMIQRQISWGAGVALNAGDGNVLLWHDYTFATIIEAMYARYRIGLSGTINRTDGKHVIFKDYFGSTLYQPPQSHTVNPIVKLVPTGLALPIGVTWAKKLNELLYDEDYQNFIADVARTQINV